MKKVVTTTVEYSVEDLILLLKKEGGISDEAIFQPKVVQEYSDHSDGYPDHVFKGITVTYRTDSK